MTDFLFKIAWLSNTLRVIRISNWYNFLKQKVSELKTNKIFILGFTLIN